MKIHIIWLCLVVACFVLGRFMSGGGQSQGSVSPDVESSTGATGSEEKFEKVVSAGKKSEIPVAPKSDKHFDKLAEFLPKEELSKTLLAMAKIEDVAMMSEHQEKYRAYIQEIGSDPEGSFAVLGQSVESLPSEFEKERLRFLQLAVELDVSKERKLELLEKVMFDERYSSENPEKQLGRIVTFDLILEQGGPEVAKQVLEKGEFKGEMAKLLKQQLAARNPAQN